MTAVLLVGLGEVGRRTARQLVDTDGLDRVILVDRDASRAGKIAEAMGPSAAAAHWMPGDPLPGGLAAVACALPAGLDLAVAQAAIGAGVPLASVADDHRDIEGLFALDSAAKEAGVTIAAGCGLAPGLADVLACHAAAGFDAVDEIRVSRAGWAGPASAATVRRERRGPVREWHEGHWREVRSHGDELVWFPDPIDGRDCRVVTAGVALLVDAFPGVESVSVHLGEPARRRFVLRRFGDDGEWGAARVEVWGRRGTTRDLLVYGVIERTAVAAGTVLAVTAAHLAGAGVSRMEKPGVRGLAALADPVPFLADLARRGVRAAVFEGVPVS